MERTLALIAKSHQGDKKARNTLVEENIGLVYSIVRRFLGRGIEMEDLVQIGSIGLIKAVDKFDTGFEVQFSTYAVPMIAGEIKRFLRDDGMIKVSRSLKENARKVFSARERLEKCLGREPCMQELSAETGLSGEEIVMAMESSAEVDSIYRTIYQGDGNAISLEDRLEEKDNPNERLLDHLVLQEVMDSLEEQEKKLIKMRYFEEKTQNQVAAALSMTQVQVSRMEKKVLKKMRGRFF
ncbi:SigB/SigF/SigG family RNA polymerase sigma factor [Blautia sp. OF03-15BH]|uniref:SigF/SigG family RNA polymerase sporulation sigma factor n=1 Tax=Blautia sp. OF03-15BH TaxID=2292287 RepID=UPI000E50F9A4|nr:SigF/SigG family RNA polymerase sporulation sigma factor [Blautia sp. OF03-15BH]RGY03017.1 SigB/SigF/SigG family RNA polymerase sigma factor [Blautia sp. OF03-15BH]